MDIIYQRRSIRKYSDRPVEKEKIVEIIRAGMAAPSSENQQPWFFMVIDDKEVLHKIPEFIWCAPVLKKSPCAILVCADKSYAKEPEEFWWVQDCAAATQNMLLEIEHQGLGGVWIGVHPDKQFVDGMKHLLDLPEEVVPFAIISLGYKGKEKEPTDRYYKERVYHNKWKEAYE